MSAINLSQLLVEGVIFKATLLQTKFLIYGLTTTTEMLIIKVLE